MYETLLTHCAGWAGFSWLGRLCLLSLVVLTFCGTKELLLHKDIYVFNSTFISRLPCCSFKLLLWLLLPCIPTILLLIQFRKFDPVDHRCSANLCLNIALCKRWPDCSAVAAHCLAVEFCMIWARSFSKQIVQVEPLGVPGAPLREARLSWAGLLSSHLSVWLRISDDYCLMENALLALAWLLLWALESWLCY